MRDPRVRPETGMNHVRGPFFGRDLADQQIDLCLQVDPHGIVFRGQSAHGLQIGPERLDRFVPRITAEKEGLHQHKPAIEPFGRLGK